MLLDKTCSFGRRCAFSFSRFLIMHVVFLGKYCNVLVFNISSVFTIDASGTVRKLLSFNVDKISDFMHCKIVDFSNTHWLD